MIKNETEKTVHIHRHAHAHILLKFGLIRFRMSRNVEKTKN